MKINFNSIRILEEIIVGKNLSFHFAGHYIVKNGEVNLLTLTENKLLLFFIKNRGKRVSIKEIIKYMEKHSLYCSEQNLYVYISRLRKKLENDPKNPEFLINMRPGYIFLVENK
ncbi:helix-turn-helix domain-containing protein [Paenibacillus sp. FSL P2-0536]|uniref:winged helix-turn-helix domain-containing protein n=1 Tax=Paenibacillus sp. FSL P2-0536 TaxID=2921629 RepID=UPI0030FB3838